MNLQNEDQNSQDNVFEKLHEVQKKSKILYTTQFLLSLRDLDICKNLPSGFDESILSEFVDASQSMQDRPRNSGSFPLQGFRRIEYGSIPPTRGDSSNFSRGTYGRWESHSGRSDRDNDSQSDKDSDSGRRYSHPSRRSWQTPEHDGLLGSGSFPRPSGYAAGISVAKVRANENYQLSKKNEPYQPPRPYKAIPHSRRDTDSINDETFGSTEYTSDDRAEEEKRRRDSFVLMRKEQQKSLQENQKMSLEKHKVDNALDLCESLEGNKEEKGLLGGYNELDVSTASTPVLSNEFEKSSFSSNASRPSVPPGFTNNILENSSDTKSLVPLHLAEIGKHVAGERLLHFRTNPAQNGNVDGFERQLSKKISSVDGQTEDKNKCVPLLNEGKIVNSHSSLGVPHEKVSREDQCDPTSFSDDHGILNESELNAKVLEDKVVGKSEGNYSSVLEKKFGSTLTLKDDGTVDSAEHHNGKVPDTWSPKSTPSSKFARWFSEEEAQSVNDISAGRPNDLLSLIVTSDKERSQVSAAKPEHFTHESSELASKSSVNMPSATNGVSEEVFSSNKKEVTSTVLTCEDIEQSILSEYSQKNSNTMPLLKGWSASSTNFEQPREHDDHASQHLLSLLQKGSDPNTMTLGPIPDIGFGDKVLVFEEHEIGTAVDDPKAEEQTNNIHYSGKTLTLETLFGTAFMKELQSVEAPISVQRGSNASAQVAAPEPHGLSFPVMENGVSSYTIDEIGLQRTSHENSVLSSNHRDQTNLAKSGNWLGFDDSQINSSKHPTEVVAKHGGYSGAVEFQLPEYESLISVGDSLKPQLSTLMPTGNSSKNELLSSNVHVDIAENFAAMGAVIKDNRTMVGSESLPFARGPYEQTDPEIPYRNIQVQPSPPQFQPPHMSHVSPLFHPLDSYPAYTSSQKKFMGPVRVAGYNLHAHRSMLHPMPMPGNRPQLLPDFPRGAPVPYPGNQTTSFIQDMNPMQGFPFGPHQPNIGSVGMSMPAPDNSFGNPPEAFQRLVEMELQANSKQIHPFHAAHDQGVYSHEPDIRFPSLRIEGVEEAREFSDRAVECSPLCGFPILEMPSEQTDHVKTSMCRGWDKACDSPWLYELISFGHVS
ncbi:unnamed protein product [Fraxinus pennsylvanica]|uniref:Uncharacterized protein n=1 Tax=Fraxinus pennsylvanica TaxID=56036 RepID=A0AAD2AE33_9LAMI|nr:unnamed protein product [Fraxinus pennsylvanica]